MGETKGPCGAFDLRGVKMRNQKLKLIVTRFNIGDFNYQLIIEMSIDTGKPQLLLYIF